MLGDIFRASVMTVITFAFILTVPNFHPDVSEVIGLLSSLMFFYFGSLRLCALILWFLKRMQINLGKRSDK